MIRQPADICEVRRAAASYIVVGAGGHRPHRLGRLIRFSRALWTVRIQMVSIFFATSHGSGLTETELQSLVGASVESTRIQPPPKKSTIYW